MAITSDMGAIVVGAALGYGLRNEIKSASTIAKAGLLAGLGVAAVATAAAVNEQEKQQAAEAAAAAAQAAGAAQSNGGNNGN